MNITNAIMFVADAMLGKLARYLRIMGYDTVYQTSYPDQRLSELVTEGRKKSCNCHTIFKLYLC
ncbi:MAG: hypothetical protein JRI72_17575 [Deltaproteobacteria bacterium]|nr:hypothetical protein [Deltaproteobacteria bacterium]